MATYVPLCAGKDVSERDFALMMADEAFVDFFNVFLSLPVFPQRMIYIFSKKDFEFDPPIKNRNVILQKQHLVKWLLNERLPYFMRSEYYLEYLMCENLLQLKLHLSPSSHRLDYDEEKTIEDKEKVKLAIGNVAGMCHFRNFLAETPGAQIMAFWKDAERFNRVPKDLKAMREACFREIQMKYFKTEGYVNIPDNSLWQVLRDSRLVLEDEDYQNLPDRDTPPSCFRKLQGESLSILKEYWLHRYLIHTLNLQASKRAKVVDDTKTDKSLSDTLISQDVKTIDKMLARIKDKKPNAQTENNRARYNWNAMFPHTKIDDSFLQSTENVVTLHEGNKITVCPVGSEYEMMLHRYFSETDSEDEEEVISPAQGYAPKWEMAPILIKKEESPELQTKKLVAKIALAEAERMKRRRLGSAENLALFEQLVMKNEVDEMTEAKTVRILNQSDSQRPSTSGETRRRVSKIAPKWTGSEHASLKLPLLGKRWERDQGKYRTHKQRQKEYTEHARKAAMKSQFPPILERAMPAEGSNMMELPTYKRPAQVNVMEFEFTNLCKGNYRIDNKLYVCSLAVDAVCGRPFASYLHKYSHTNAISVLRFWSEIHTYLSLKPVVFNATLYEKIRFWRAHKMVVRFLTKEMPSPIKKEKEQPLIPFHACQYLRKMILQGQGDDLLTIVQDYLSKVIYHLWTSYTFLDKDDFDTATMIRKTAKELFSGASSRRPKLAVSPTVTRENKHKDEGNEGNEGNETPQEDDILKKFVRKVKKTEPDSDKKSNIIRFQFGEVIKNVQEKVKSDRTVVVKVEEVIDESSSPPPPQKPERGTSPRPQKVEERKENKDRETQLSPSGGKEKVKSTSNSRTTSKSSSRSSNRSSTPKNVGSKETNKRSITPSSGRENGNKEEVLGDFLEEFDIRGLEEKRMWRALQLVAYLTEMETETLLLDPLPFQEVLYNDEDTSGSLAVKKRKIIKRRDLVEAEVRKKQAEEKAYNHRIAMLKKKAVEDLPPEFLDESIPDWAKPFKKETGRWAYRPNYPKTFTDIFKDPIRIEFFRRYLEAKGGAAQLNFWKDVESMKKASDTTYRQQKINQIIRRYFLSARGYASLECRDDVIKEIPKMEKVTPAMLISGQSCIAKQLEKRWFLPYQATFPEPDGEEEDEEKKDVQRQWTTERSRALWVHFVRTIMRFRHAILDPKLTNEFAEYLRSEITREIDKQKVGGMTYVPGLPIKKVIKNKLIDITKLVNDLAFLAEAERFRALCDNASDAAKQGIYKVDDQELLDIKAHIIITCYMDSEIPPRIQINASVDTVDEVTAAFQSGLVDRGLFHAATMGVFPILAYMWKRFQRFRYIQAFGGPVKPELVKAEVLDRSFSPNFMDLSHTDGKTVVSLHEDDQPRMIFSMAHGMRVILPPTREQLMKRVLEATLSRGQGAPSHTDASRRMTLAMIDSGSAKRHKTKLTKPKSNADIIEEEEDGHLKNGSSRGSLSTNSDVSITLDGSNLTRRPAIFSKMTPDSLLDTRSKRSTSSSIGPSR